MSLYRVATANAYDRTVQNINRRQAEIAQSQEQLSSGKRVLRASDDAVAATLAERAQNRLARTEVDLTALESSRSALVQAESSLAEASEIMHRMRELVVQAGDPILTPDNREDLAKQIEGLREQMLAIANRKDANGFTLFGGLGGAVKPFVDLYGQGAGVRFEGQDGQYAATEYSLPHNVNGNAVWMRVPQGNGLLVTSLGTGNQGNSTATLAVNSPVGFPDPAPTFRVEYHTALNDPNTLRVRVIDEATGQPVPLYDNNNAPLTPLDSQPYDASTPLRIFPGAGDIDITLSGTPQEGDAFYLRPGQAPANADEYTSEPLLANRGSLWANQTELTGKKSLSGSTYRVEFVQTGDVMQFRVRDLTSGDEVQPLTDYVPGKEIEFETGAPVPGEAAFTLQMNGTPKPGDTVLVAPSQNSDLFRTMQNTIDALRYNGPNEQGERPHQISRSLKELDTGLNRILDMRGRLGEWLNRADSMEGLFKDRAVFYQNEQSTQEDLDMVKGISEFQSRQTALQAALQSYAQVQKLSLFQYIA